MSMNKENDAGEVEETLTAEQKARISLKFRAAKALLARKKPRFSLSPNISNEERTPLKEVHINSNSPLCASASSRFSNQSHQNHVWTETESVLTPINTGPGLIHSLHCSPPSTLLDDDFDSSIFHQIDLLCATTTNSQAQGQGVSAAPAQVQVANEIQTTRNNLPAIPESYSKFLDSLNDDQFQAASTPLSTPLMVVAGPGSGKTSTMVGRVLMLLSQGVAPSHILAMTFTTAAASEMRDRIGAVAGKEVAKALTISTFHSFSLQLCRAHADKYVFPNKYLLEQRAVATVDGGKLLNEDNDLRSVLEYLLDDVTHFLSSQYVPRQDDSTMKNKGCIHILKAFVDYISEREKENFRCRRQDNQDSVTLTTIHQSKGLEWDIVFIVKANDSEIPLIHEHNGTTKERGNSLEEERRLLYVAMTRARKKLFILYVTMDSNWQVLRPSRFLQEIPAHLMELQADLNVNVNKIPLDGCKSEAVMGNNSPSGKIDETSKELQSIEALSGTCFLKKFNVEDRGLVSRIFHQWAKKKAFQEPKRLLDKVHFVIDERLRVKKANNKELLVALKSFLKSDEALQFAEYVISWEQIPTDKRVHLMREKQEHFQKVRMESAMGSSSPTSKQISYLHKLGCTVVPESKLHASRLIEQYKSL